MFIHMSRLIGHLLGCYAQLIQVINTYIIIFCISVLYFFILSGISTTLYSVILSTYVIFCFFYLFPYLAV